jgi:DNA-binding transcriptional MerR regulator
LIFWKVGLYSALGAGVILFGMRDVGTLSTGEFGRLSGLSVKALRLYDVSGLLRPVSTDPVTGYRRYSREQLERARRISLLRGMDMPLGVIEEVLGGTDDEAGLRLDRWWSTQEAAMHARRGSYGWLRGQLAHAGEPERSYAVRVRDVPDTKVATLQAEVDQSRLVEAISETQWTVREHLVAQGARATHEFWVIYHGLVTPDNEAVIETAIPFTGSVEPAGAIAIRMEAAHREAYATVLRDDCFYPRIVGAYEAVLGHAPGVGPVREIYLDFWDQVAGDEPFVHVAQPIAG